MLEQFKHPYKYKIQFSSDTKIGYVNVVTFGTKSDAINLFLKHCRLQHPNVIDCKFIGIVLDYDSGGSGEIGTLTFQTNGETIGTFSGESTVIDIAVPTKMSQLENDSSYLTRDDISDELVNEIKEDIEAEIGGNIESSKNKITILRDDSTDVEYPSAKAVVDYINKCFLSDEDINDIINGF